MGEVKFAIWHESARFTFRSFTCSAKRTKVIAEQENDDWKDCGKPFSSIKLLNDIFK